MKTAIKIALSLGAAGYLIIKIYDFIFPDTWEDDEDYWEWSVELDDYTPKPG